MVPVWQAVSAPLREAGLGPSLQPKGTEKRLGNVTLDSVLHVE